ncbi:unnamed protein product [Diatraea saccharalis]|uniref:P/Homo B domain-containing protein n=1 Tax=Diatraea saccharalis TaxID=40085 RepID=A0A9N9R7X2_9NEOP|nr:unnamed protein product [Diatraea saccharalis]
MNWPLTSVATWGESSNGIWKVTFLDETDEHNSGEVGPLRLVVHGTHQMPDHMRKGPRKYTHDDYNNYEIFKLFDNNVFENENLDSDDNNVPEEHETEQVDFNEIDSTILAEVEQELKRIHHRMVFDG